MDRAIASGAIGREFESLRAHQISSACHYISEQLGFGDKSRLWGVR
jgi:hypothetical protein